MYVYVKPCIFKIINIVPLPNNNKYKVYVIDNKYMQDDSHMHAI